MEIQAYCGMIVCMLILLYTGEKPNRAMYQMVWYYLIGQWGSLLRGRGLQVLAAREEGGQGLPLPSSRRI